MRTGREVRNFAWHRAIKACNEIFMHHFRFSKKCYVGLCFMWNPWTNYWAEILVSAWFSLFEIL